MGRKKFFYKYPKLINLYPPFIGAGVKLREINEDKTQIIVDMRLRWYNRNVYGTHFGGSLYAMTDPFYVFIVYYHFGDDYIIWDKSASIKFVRPGKGKVTGTYNIPLDTLALMKSQVDQGVKTSFMFSTEVIDELNKVVAYVEKEIYIKAK